MELHTLDQAARSYALLCRARSVKPELIRIRNLIVYLQICRV